MALKRVEVRYAGRVQGVGFRFTAERFAHAHGIKGYVKNLGDGRVELIGEGAEQDLKNFLHDLNEDLERYIDHHSIDWFPATGEFKRFEIRF